MERLTFRELSEILDRYVMPAKQLFPLCSESLTHHLCTIANDYISEEDLIYSFNNIGYKPYISKDMMWNNGCPGPAWFKIRFVRDIHTRGLFSYYDTSLCKSNILKRIIRNAKDNTERRVRDFCWYVNTSPDICTIDVSDDEITEYIMWLSKHTSSPRSTMAALLLFYLDIRFANILSPDQLQFIRENPNLKIR